MKCMQDNKTNVISRITDDKAAKLFSKGTHKYASKSEWKRQIAWKNIKKGNIPERILRIAYTEAF